MQVSPPRIRKERESSGRDDKYWGWRERPAWGFDFSEWANARRVYTSWNTRQRQGCDNQSMAKGWDSKSVEEQQDAADRDVADKKAQRSADEIQRQREVAALNLQRSHIMNARTANPHRRAALQAALEHVEGQLVALGVTDLN